MAIENARLYEEARSANQTKSELLAVISHDLRTPLNSIIGYAQLLQMGIPDVLPPKTAERVIRIQTAAQHQLYLIDELLSFARLDSHHEDVRCRDVDLKRLLTEMRTW